MMKRLSLLRLIRQRARSRCSQELDTLKVRFEASSRLRWDHDQALTNTDGLVLCSLCNQPISEDWVPLIMWKNDGNDVATVGQCCERELFEVSKS